MLKYKQIYKIKEGTLSTNFLIAKNAQPYYAYQLIKGVNMTSVKHVLAYLCSCL